MNEHHRIVTPGEWLNARLELLAKEKEFTRLRDQLSEQCRELPWVEVGKQYVFDGGDGRETLAQLFEIVSAEEWLKARRELLGRRECERAVCV
jgi:predicted dithiol-disulfide oxidoreductase (DUF899 family)